MIAGNSAEEKFLGVGTKYFADELDIEGTIHILDASASLVAVGHVLVKRRSIS